MPFALILALVRMSKAPAKKTTLPSGRHPKFQWTPEVRQPERCQTRAFALDIPGCALAASRRKSCAPYFSHFMSFVTCTLTTTLTTLFHMQYDALLLQLINTSSEGREHDPWGKISARIPGSTAKTCRDR